MTSKGTFHKGLGSLTTQDEIASIGARGWNLLRGDMSLPAAVLIEPRLKHNLHWMSLFAQRYGVQLAPHGKTTMAPDLFNRQLSAGAWGITLATAHQCLIAHAHGVRRILMANQLVGRANCEIISDLLGRGAEFYTLVDSVALVDQLGTFFAGKGQQLQVLLEIGVEGGRTGMRDDTQLHSVIDALTRWTGTLSACGLEVYEGVLQDEASVRTYLERALQTFKRLQHQGFFAADKRPLLSGAGSAWYDVVADVFGSVRNEATVILRPGCYLTCDGGLYRAAQHQVLERNRVAREVDEQLGGSLRSAMEVWACVQSMPEPRLAIAAFGKRDAAFDAGLPLPTWQFRPGVNTHPREVPTTWATTKLMDQHAYLAIPDGADLQIGDMIGFSISHPCLTFDKWRYLTIVDEHYNVIEAIPTYF